MNVVRRLHTRVPVKRGWLTWRAAVVCLVIILLVGSLLIDRSTHGRKNPLKSESRAHQRSRQPGKPASVNGRLRRANIDSPAPTRVHQRDDEDGSSLSADEATTIPRTPAPTLSPLSLVLQAVVAHTPQRVDLANDAVAAQERAMLAEKFGWDNGLDDPVDLQYKDAMQESHAVDFELKKAYDTFLVAQPTSEFRAAVRRRDAEWQHNRTSFENNYDEIPTTEPMACVFVPSNGEHEHHREEVVAGAETWYDSATYLVTESSMMLDTLNRRVAGVGNIRMDLSEWRAGHERRVLGRKRLRRRGSKPSQLRGRGELTLPIFAFLSKALREKRSEFEHCRWFVKADSDAYVHKTRLEQQLARYDHNKPYYVGSSFPFCSTGFNYGQPSACLVYQLGGPTYALSRDLLKNTNFHRCLMDGARDPIWLIHDDVGVGRCVARYYFGDSRLHIQEDGAWGTDDQSIAAAADVSNRLHRLGFVGGHARRAVDPVVANKREISRVKELSVEQIDVVYATKEEHAWHFLRQAALDLTTRADLDASVVAPCLGCLQVFHPLDAAGLRLLHRMLRELALRATVRRLPIDAGCAKLFEETPVGTTMELKPSGGGAHRGNSEHAAGESPQQHRATEGVELASAAYVGSRCTLRLMYGRPPDVGMGWHVPQAMVDPLNDWTIA